MCLHFRALTSQDALARDMSILVFCPTKVWCHKLAALLTSEILKDETLGVLMRAQDQRNERTFFEHKSCPEGQQRTPGGGTKYATGGGVVGGSHDHLSMRSPSGNDAMTKDPKSSADQKDPGSTAGGNRVSAGAGICVPSCNVTPGEPMATPAARPAALAVMEKLKTTPVGLDHELRSLVRNAQSQ